MRIPSHQDHVREFLLFPVKRKTNIELGLDNNFGNSLISWDGEILDGLIQWAYPVECFSINFGRKRPKTIML